MNLEKLKPWNWFKHEENENGEYRRVPLVRDQAERRLPAGTGSLLSLQREMDRRFDEAFKSFGLPPLWPSPGSMPYVGSAPGEFYRPQIDVSGDDNSYQITLDVPGMTESDLSLELAGDVLSIKGRKEERNESRDKHYYRVERSYGSFQRTLALPDDANADEIEARLDRGVLRLEMPRRAGVSGEVKRISITA